MKLTGRNLFSVYICTIAFGGLFSCDRQTNVRRPTFRYIEPQWQSMQVIITKDTINYLLDGETYNEIKSFNTFTENKEEYISFYDRRSESISIYHFLSGRLRKKVLLENTFKKGSLYKTSVYCKNFDSIFVTNRTSLYLLDSTGKKRKSIKFLKKPRFAWAYFDSTNPPVFEGNKMYAGVRMYVKETSFDAIKDWRVLYEFDLAQGKATLFYQLPQFYKEKYYGRRLMEQSYCFNNNKRFVFSFTGDTVIYETNLSDYHVSYIAKTNEHENKLMDVSKEDLLNDKASLSYYLNNSYDAVYYDEYNERYLRLMRSRISVGQYESKRKEKRQSVIILDKNFRIIGESPLNAGVYIKSLVFSRHGIYAQVNTNDEYALHFVRLSYVENEDENRKLSKR